MIGSHRVLAALPVAIFLGLMAPAVALAHDVHHFGKVTVALGWLHEPAYAGSDNAVQVIVKDAGGNALANLTDKDLTVSITAQGQTLANQPLVPTADPDTGLGTPGEYLFHFVPTAPGTYAFHVIGTVAGQAVDDNVTSSDKTFNNVSDPTSAEFPVTVPSTTDINTKTDRVDTRAKAAQDAAGSASNDARLALIVGGVALVAAMLLNALTVVAVRRRPRG